MSQVSWLPDPPGVTSDDSLSGSTHRNRAHLEHVMSEPGVDDSWDALRHDYREQAADWRQWSVSQAGYADAVVAAVDHLARLPWWQANPDPFVLEVGAGTGEAALILHGRFPRLIVSDVSWQMMRQADGSLQRIVADVRKLPFGNASVDVIVGLNAVPNSAEFNRVIKPSGRLVWCTSYGPHTPLHLDPNDFARSLGSQWHGVAQRAGSGDWCLLQR